MFVEAAGYPKNEGLWGVYYRTDDWTPVPMEGEELEPGRIRMFELLPSLSSRTGARLDLTLPKRGDVSGTWWSFEEGQTRAVRLRRVPQPPSYETAITKKTRRFADPRWPFEFSYPADWLMSASAESLVLRSHDPQAMLSGNTLTCERGSGLPVASPDEPFKEFRGSYYRTRDGWMVAAGPASNCPGSSCEAPKTRRHGATLIMSAATSYRAHNPWGYAGIGEGMQYLIVAGNEWAHCFDGVLDSEARIQPKAP